MCAKGSNETVSMRAVVRGTCKPDWRRATPPQNLSTPLTSSYDRIRNGNQIHPSKFRQQWRQLRNINYITIDTPRILNGSHTSLLEKVQITQLNPHILESHGDWIVHCNLHTNMQFPFWPVRQLRWLAIKWSWRVHMASLYNNHLNRVHCYATKQTLK